MFRTYLDYIYNKLSTLSDVSVYKYLASKVDYPALIIIADGSEGERATAGDYYTEREYKFSVRIEYAISDNYLSINDVEDKFLELVDNVISLFDGIRTTRADTTYNDIVTVGSYELGVQNRENPIRWARFNISFKKLNNG